MLIDSSAEERIRRNLGRLMFLARWIMVPFYLGLLAALALDAVKFVQKLIEAWPMVLAQPSNDTIFTVLSLIDLCLVGNLIVIVIFAGWQTFVGPFLARSADDRPDPLAALDFSAVKLRLIGSVVVIAAILILETFVHIDETPRQDAILQLAILLGLGVTGVLLAVMDRLGGHE